MLKNIAVLSTTFLPIQGGVQYLLYWLMKEIDRNYTKYQKIYGFNNFSLIVPEYKNNNFDDFKNIKVIYINHPKNKLESLKNILLINKIIRKNKISLVHVHNGLSDGILFLLGNTFSKIKFIITSHGEDFAYNINCKYGHRLSFVKSFLIKLISMRANMITTVSSDMVDFVKEIVPSQKIIKIENCFEPRFNYQNNGDIDQIINLLKKQYKITKKDSVFLTLSGARKIKGHNQMLLSFSKALKNSPHLKLFIAAHGDETKNLQNQVNELKLGDKVFFIGFIDGVLKKAFFKLSNVYINTAYFEPFGLVYLEAILNDMAVLGSIYGGGKDIFQHLHNAYLCDPYKPDSITAGILYLSHNRHRVLLKNKASKLISNYSPKVISAKYFKLYNQILNETTN